MENIIRTIALKDILSAAVSSTIEKQGQINPIDVAYLTVLNTEGCYANYILKKLLKDWEIDTMRNRLQLDLDRTKYSRKFDPTSFYRDLYKKLTDINQEICPNCDATLNTGHLLLYAIKYRDSYAHKMLELYDIKTDSVIDLLSDLPEDEDTFVNHEIRDSHTDNIPENKPDQHHRISETISVRKQPKRNVNLRRYSVNLTDQARDNQFDPVIGREKELERMIQVLGRRKKNNPVLIGDAGVGKSALVEGLATRIVAREVPVHLQNKTIYALDVSMLIAGTKYRGEFEERMNEIIKELRNDPDAIIFIDEIHMIVGAGGTQGGIDSSNMLKPALARGEIRCIGATTFDEYRERIENDSALDRRFQKIIVNPASAETSLKILESVKDRYEAYHNVTYTEDALKACVDLTGRYINDRKFPDKALDAMDEAGSKAHIIAGQQDDEIERLKEIMKFEKSKAYKASAEERIYDATKAYAIENKIKKKIKELQERKLEKPIITKECIYHIISLMTGIPIQKISGDEKKRLQTLKEYLNGIVIGQEEAVATVSKSILRSRIGLKDPNRPTGVFMFVGPTGVGKTLLAKELAKWVFDGEDSLIRLDMSEYSEKHNVSRMIGSPPGYVGYGQGGQLTEAVRRKPYSVILFDEIEKAHSDVFNIMLQILDDGQLTDGSGRYIDFRDTIIILTSNVGTTDMEAAQSIGFKENAGDENASSKKRYKSALKNHFRPEFLNRIDNIVVFHELSEADIRKIADIEIDKLVKRSRMMGYKVQFSEAVRNKVALKGYDKQYGARSLRRAVVSMLEDPLAEYIVLQDIPDNGNSTIKMDVRKGFITICPAKSSVRPEKQKAL